MNTNNPTPFSAPNDMYENQNSNCRLLAFIIIVVVLLIIFI